MIWLTDSQSEPVKKAGEQWMKFPSLQLQMSEFEDVVWMMCGKKVLKGTIVEKPNRKNSSAITAIVYPAKICQ